ncbi:cell division control protein 45 homolog [Stylophora pistillata]|uniref:cell division control protein 45 homolog n=1 Tax=Stylophora pistillata TaxID=50429 RepID=UPI000C0436B8|nr:cell division control protein 45 homolog [Stylophora pistillata]
MFVEKPKEEVYDVIINKRVLVLVSMDLDSLCACKILQWLFKCDNVQYTIVPVSGKEDLVRAYHEHFEQLKHIFLINCGANLNILEMLEPEEDVMFFIADSHRPIDLDNIYNQDQVKLLMKEGEHLTVPDFDDIYADSEDEFGDSDSDESEPFSKRRRTGEGDSPVSKRMSKRQWHQNRQEILYQYYAYAFHGSSASLVMYELAWKMSKDSNDLLWWAAIGLTHQYLYEKIDRLRLSLYRHWSLFDSICNSRYTACRFRVWTMKGKKKLNEFLADMGIPLVQSKQKFYSMDFDLRNNLKGWVETSADKFGLDEMSYGTFHVQYGFKNKLCASDVVYAVNALLEAPDTDGMSKWDHFLEALDALSRSNTEKLQEGIKLGKKQLIAVVEQVRSLIDMHQVMCAGHFLYSHLREGIPDLNLFSKPAVLGALARFILNAYVVMSKNKKAAALPFVLAAPLDTEKGTCLLVGVPPIADDSGKNFLGKAFEMAASKTKSRTIHDHFDPAVIEMKSEDRGKFFDALSALLIPK